MSETLRARMREVLERELIERARARLASRAAAEGETPREADAATSGDGLEKDVLRLAAAALRMPEDRIDPDEILDRIDVNALMDRVDLDALIARLDLAAITLEVIEEIDLAGIVRESAGDVAGESVEEIRAGTAAADHAVARAIDRVLRRRRDAGGHADT